MSASHAIVYWLNAIDQSDFFLVILMSNSIYYLLLDRGEPPSLHPCYKEGVNGGNYNFLVS